VVCDSHLAEWAVYELSTAGFLRAVLSVPTPVELLTFVAEAEQPPAYQGVDGSSSGPPAAGPDEAYWIRATGGLDLIGPADCVDQLRDLVTPAPIEVAWSTVEGRVGWPPPADYQHLIEELGAVTVGPVTVRAPDGSSGFVERYEQLRRRIVRERAVGGGPPGTVWPEPGGVLPWADLDGGGTVCWLTAGRDTANWPVILVDAEMRRSTLYPMTASRFLLELATNPEGVVLEPPV
jgi:hypothetical protein